MKINTVFKISVVFHMTHQNIHILYKCIAKFLLTFVVAFFVFLEYTVAGAIYSYVSVDRHYLTSHQYPGDYPEPIGI